MTVKAIKGTENVAGSFRSRAPFMLLILAVSSSLVLIVMDATPLDTEFAYVVLTTLSMMIIWALIGIWSATLYVRYARRRIWRQSLLPVVLFVTSLLIGFNFSAFLSGCNYLGGAMRFAITRAYYSRQIAILPNSEKPRFAIFNWGGMLWSSRGVVYDESDEIALPIGQQSATWRANPNLEELSCGKWHARRLSSHFYLVDFLC